jgi:hypothetical protein
MGIALGDYNGSGRLGLLITTFSDDYKTLYRNDGGATFTDVSFKAGLGSPTIPFLGWGTGFLDFDNDGLLDLFIANGHVYPIADQRDWGTTWAQRPQLFRNLDGAKFQEVPPATGSGLAAVVSARGAAFGDLFNDGHTDVVLNNLDSAPTLLRNVVHNGNHWITVKLVAQTFLSAPPPTASASAATSSAAPVTPPPLTPASISASVLRPKSTSSKSSGPAASVKKSPRPASTASSKPSKGGPQQQS